MMIEDRLTRNERIRLEALAQTKGMSNIHPDDWETMKVQAEKVEQWLKEADMKGNN